MREDKILEIIREWQDEILHTEGITRYCEDQIQKSLGSKPIKIITGFRRSGKSYLCRRLARKLINENYSLKNVLYLNFEDYKLNWVQDLNSLAKVYDVFKAFSADNNSPILLILDEIQKIPQWESFVRTLYEKNNCPQIIITGSNSDMLSSELCSSLSGRFIEFFLLPFSFSEYLDYHALNKNPQTQITKLTNDFYDYCKIGGLAETYSISDFNTRKSFLQGVISKVMLDDIIKRFTVRNETALELILKFILANNGTIISFSKISKHLKNLNIKIQDETVIEYVGYLKKSFTIFEVPKFEWSTKKIFASSRKYYAIDIGIANQFRDLVSNFSLNLENLILLKLKSDPNIKNIYYGFEDMREIDFITEDFQGNLSRFQVCQELNELNQERELEPLIRGDKFFRQSQPVLLNLKGITRCIKYKCKDIEQINLIEWLLN